MYGLSFREYLELFEAIECRTYTLEEVLKHKVEMPAKFRPLMYFRRYLEKGYYPFALEDDYERNLLESSPKHWKRIFLSMLT